MHVRVCMYIGNVRLACVEVVIGRKFHNSCKDIQHGYPHAKLDSFRSLAYTANYALMLFSLLLTFYQSTTKAITHTIDHFRRDNRGIYNINFGDAKSFGSWDVMERISLELSHLEHE